MPYKIEYRDKALGFLDGLEKKFAGQIVRKIETQLTADPFGFGEKLQKIEHEGIPAFKIRSGNYRILYTIHDDNRVVIHVIDDRKDVYKNQ